MTIKSSNGKDALFTEINITPLTDIFLVLLIIMMVVAPTFQSVDENINIPEINSGVSVEHTNATVAVTSNGEMFINSKKVEADSEVIAAELASIKDSLEKKEVVVKADQAAKSKEIMKIMRAAQDAGYEKLVVAGEPLSKKEQKKLTEDNQEG